MSLSEGDQRRYRRAVERLAGADAAVERYAAKLAFYSAKYRAAREAFKRARKLLESMEQEVAEPEPVPSEDA